MKIDIPNFKTLEIEHLVLDFNGTVAKDGILIEEIRPLLITLCKKLHIYIITADTFGTVLDQLKGLDIDVEILKSDNHTLEKQEFIKHLGNKNCVAIGNGNNDHLMLKEAALGIAILGDEGCSAKTLLISDLICKDIVDALELFIYPKRVIATLRE